MVKLIAHRILKPLFLFTFAFCFVSSVHADGLPKKLTYQELANQIDAKIDARLKQNGMNKSAPCTDEEFIRRVYLDITGVVPSAEKVVAFLESKATDKREKLVDELLDSPKYGKYFAEIWSNAMLPKESNNRRLQSEPMEKWLREQFMTNQPWDKIVHDIVTASGPVDKNQAVTFYVANPTADKMTNQVTQLFLGVQLQCAQCHNHPFTDWKQDEYWGMAAFFMRVNVNGNPNQAAKNGKTLVVSELPTPPKNKKRLPENAKIVPAKFLADVQPDLKSKAPARPVLADWMTSNKNPYFARAISNKLWYHFFGRGIVNPVDDMHDDNPASHPELLAELSEQMKANQYDLKYLVRAICNSQTYQTTSRGTGNNADDKELFSHSMVRMLSPEQLYDSIDQVLQVSQNQDVVVRKGKKKQPANARNRGAALRDQFVAFFSTDNGFNPLEYQSGIPQALRLMNSRQMNTLVAVNAMMKTNGKEPAKMIEQMYLTALSRRPTAGEVERMTKYVADQSNPRDAYADILWALLNSSEFALNH